MPTQRASAERRSLALARQVPEYLSQAARRTLALNRRERERGPYYGLEGVLGKAAARPLREVEGGASAIALRASARQIATRNEAFDGLGCGATRGGVKIREAGHSAGKPVRPREEAQRHPLRGRQAIGSGISVGRPAKLQRKLGNLALCVDPDPGHAGMVTADDFIHNWQQTEMVSTRNQAANHVHYPH